MTKLSLNKAAKKAGVAKSTLLERLRSQDPKVRVSAERNDRGHWMIDESELVRVFGKPQKDHRSVSSHLPLYKPQEPLPTSALAVEVKMLREQIERMDAESERERRTLTTQIDDLRTRLDESQEQARRLTGLIPSRHPSDAPQKTAERSGGLFGWLTRRN